MRRWVGLLLIACVLGSTEIPAAFVQSFAWAGMAAGRLRREGWKTSIQETFDGRHPCAICLRLNKASRAPKLSATPAPQHRSYALPPASTLPLNALEIAAAPPFLPPSENASVRAPAFPPPETTL